MNAKIIFGTLAVTLLLVIGTAFAAKSTCATIQDGTIKDIKGNIITLGYDKWGYNYQAHMFEGFLDNAGRPSTLVTNGDMLIMKWNDAWLSNKDCGTQDPFEQAEYDSLTTPDHYLDRHYPTDTYIGSGAWLTNHANGEYMDVAGSYVINVNWLGTDYPETLILTQSGTDITGVTLDTIPFATASHFVVTSGSVIGNEINIYANKGSLVVHMEGTIAPDGSMSGSWADESPGTRTGTWSTVSGNAKMCSWSDFVKIVAVPSTAQFVSDPSACPTLYGLDGNMWYTADNVEIGCSIWGSFALIQDIYSDPCGLKQYDQPYHSPFRSGLGNWQD